MSRMPTLFIGHGSPMNAIEENDFTNKLKEIGKMLPIPKSILMVSAHWETEGTWVTAMERPKTIHDFYGFPQELFQFEYPAPGSPALAQQILDLVKKTQVHLDQEKWGLDHGAWSVLTYLYPEANIPVVQLSLDMKATAQFHFDLGQQLRELRDQGVMIIGSGNIVHNLRRLDWSSSATVHPWASEFDLWVKEKVEQYDFTSLIEDIYKTEAGRLSVPTAEHYLPLLYILGASDEGDSLRFIYEGIQNASIAMRSVLFEEKK